MDSLASSTFTLLASSLSSSSSSFGTCTHNPCSFCLSPLRTKPRLASTCAPPASVSTVRPALLPLFAHPAQAPSPCMSCTLRLQQGTRHPLPGPRRPCTGLRVTRPRPARSCFPTRLRAERAGPRRDPGVHPSPGRSARGPLSPSLRPLGNPAAAAFPRAHLTAARLNRLAAQRRGCSRCAASGPRGS